MLFPSRPPFPPAARLLLAGGLLPASCSSPSPTTPPAASTADTATPASSAFSHGTHADSLNGMQGHAFGEPLRNFSGLVLITKEDERGVRVYQMPPAKERGWFGKHAQDFATYYQFQDGRFAMFRAVTTGLGANRTAMREEARFLYGPGKDRNDQMSGLDWEGERVRVMYSEKLTSPVQCWLEVYSKPLLVVQQAKRRAQLQTDNTVSKPQSASSSPRGDKLTLDFISPSVSLYWTDPAPHRAGSVRQPPTTRVAQRPHTGLTVPRSSTSPPSLRPYATRYC